MLLGFGQMASDPRAPWRRILTDPVTGAPVDYGTTVYRPPAVLRDLLVTRTPFCGFPSCLRPAHRGDLDHREPHNPGAGTGPTNERNLDAYCRRHHRTKHTPGWSVHQGDDGTLTWTSPAGTRGPTKRQPSPNPYCNLPPQ